MSRFCFWHGGGRPRIEFLGYLLQDNSVSPFSSKTFSGVNIGQASPDRELIFTYFVESTSAYVFGGITVDGSGATIRQSASNVGGSNVITVGMSHIHLPTGGPASVSISFDRNVKSLSIGVYCVYNREFVGSDNVDYKFASSGSSSTSAVLSGIDIQRDGFVVSIFGPRASASGLSLSGSPFGLDAIADIDSSGSQVPVGMAHAGVQDESVTGASLTWAWTTARPYVTAAWVF
jgi:hypothetical protein